MSNGKQSKGTQALNPFLALTLIPFLPIDRSGGGKIRSEDRMIKEVPREHREHKQHHHHHHHNHKSEDSSSKSTRHSVDSSRSSGEHKHKHISRRSVDVPKSGGGREYFVLDQDVKSGGSSRR